MSEVLRCSIPTCNSLFRVGEGFPGGSVACPVCKQFTVFGGPLGEVAGASHPGVRRPFDLALLVLVLVWGALSCAAAWMAIFVLLPNQLEVIYGAGTMLVVQFLLSGGLLAGNRLVWQAARVLGVIWLLLNGLAVCVVVAMLVYFYSQLQIDFSNPALIPALAALGLEVVRIAMVMIVLVHLNSAAARRGFGIACPNCGDLEGQPGDLIFRRVRCPCCRFQWVQ